MPATRIIRSVCVYCGSSPGRLEAYSTAARALGQALVDRNIRLVYGGASVGIMGLVADTVLQLGGQAVGVIPEALMRREIAHRHLTELHITRSMHERKSMMADLSDGFIALPGGLGTLEELFEIWTWAQLGLHDKPCGLLNVEGYFDALITFLDHAVAEQFVSPAQGSRLLVEGSAGPLLDRFLASGPPAAAARWIEATET
ncbi:MAG: TIGR00730 family Rossman fold protein [Geothrix sp.]|nr:TIGR00730 family Rossman fold protein [Geothrix sp.]